MDRVSVEKSLRWAQHFVAREWQLALPIALAFIALPSLVSAILMTRLLTPVPQSMADMQALVMTLPWWLTPVALVLTIVMLTGGLALIALALLPQVSVGEAIRTATYRLPAAIAAALLLWAATLAILVLTGVLVAAFHLPAVVSLLATLAVMVAAGLYLALLLPLIVDRRTSPLATMRASRRFYQGNTLALAGSLIVYLIVTFIAALAIQLALGTVMMLVARLAGSPDIGQLLMAIVSSVTTGLQAGGLFLLLAAFYRQRVGRA